jgi:SAM-dependent methyltransferase
MAFEELKQKQSAMWGSAPFENVADRLLGDIHDHLVSRLGFLDGLTLLDVACGTGGVAERAVARGALVTGSDFAPALIETARRRAAERGLDITYDVADAEALPYDDASFDVVTSALGHIFAPDHAEAASELARSCKPGGRLGLVCWAQDGGVADMFRMLGEFQPPPPDGVGSPLAWGTRAYQQQLLGDAFELEFEDGNSPDEQESSEEMWELMSTSFGPLKTLDASLEGERREQLRARVLEFLESYRDGDTIRQPREYLLTIGTRR